MLETIVKFLAERGALVQPDALEYLSQLHDPMERIKQGLKAGREVPFVLTLEQARLLTQNGNGSAPEPKHLPEPEPVEEVRRDPDPGPNPDPGPASEATPGSAPGTAPGSQIAPETAASEGSAPADPTPEAAQAQHPAAAKDEGPDVDPEPDDQPPGSRPEPDQAPRPAASANAPSRDLEQADATPPDPAPANADPTGSPTGRGTKRPARSGSGGKGQAEHGGQTPSRQGPAGSFRQQVRQVADEVKVLLDVTGDSICEGDIDDFTKLFRDRYNRMRKLFRRRREMVGATTISRLREGQPVKVIGLVTDVKTTKNGHRIIEIEDETGEGVVLAPKSEGRLIELADTLLLDEVIGVTGKMGNSRSGGGLIIMDELVRPDVSLDKKQRSGGGQGSVVIASDVHIGADTFLTDGWDAFLDWVAQQVPSRGGDVRHLVINGDLVEGVGIYPGQEDELHIDNVFDQCRAAADDLGRLPEELNIYILPGNHDPVRPAEPQPAFPEEIQEGFTDNVRWLGNPSAVSINGVEILAYHGVSLFDYFEALSNCSMNKPIETMVEMLRRRHICPPYGGRTPLAPEHKDYMVIERVPDIFVTGHVHTAQTGEYRGTRLINASTWQAQTDYQRMMGFDPDPCKAFKVDLDSLAVRTYLFDHDEGTGGIQVDNPDDPLHALTPEVAP